MEEVEVSVYEIDGKKCILIDSVNDSKNIYHYFSNVKNQLDIYVLKDGIGDEEDSYVSLSTEHEFNYALSLFYDKYRNYNMTN